MSEGGKRMLLRNLITYLHQIVCMCPALAPAGSLRVIAWGEEPRSWSWMARFSLSGAWKSLCGTSLAILLTRHLASVSQPRLLFISDGQWHRDELSRLIQWRHSLLHVSVRAIATGPDANAKQLRQLAGASAVFNPEEIVAVLQSWVGADSAMLTEESRVLSSGEMGVGL